MTHKTAFLLLLVLTLSLSACQSSVPKPTQQAPAPTEIPPTVVIPTETQLPTPTDTAVPTDTPLPTATPGPVIVKDDFSSQKDYWGDCENCQWKDGALFFGPYQPTGTGEDQIFYVICEACGLHTYYRVAADVTFVDGYGDRTFGILAGLNEDHNFISAGTVTTFKHAIYEQFDYMKNQWVGGNFKKFNAVNAGRGTNRVEVEIHPSSAPGRGDITVSTNNEVLISLPNQPVEPTWAGLYLGWHTVGAAYDNFEYEEIPAE
jgi:hypothetical protein